MYVGSFYFTGIAFMKQEIVHFSVLVGSMNEYSSLDKHAKQQFNACFTIELN